MPRPFGYKNASEIDPVEAEYVRQIMRRLLDGESLESVARWLKDSDVRTTPGNWFSGSTIKQMMLNPRLAGFRRNNGELVISTVQPILTRGEHERLVKLLNDSSRHSGRPDHSSLVYVLAGLAVCQLCGTTMVSRKNDRKRTYVCSAAAPYFGCGRVRILADPLESEIAERVIGRLVARESLDAVEKAKQTAIREGSEADGRMAEANRRLTELAQSFAAGGVTREQLETASKPLKADITAARRAERLAEAVRLLPPAESVADWVAFWEQGNPEERRTLVSLFVERVLVGPVIRKGSKVFDPDRATVIWRS